VSASAKKPSVLRQRQEFLAVAQSGRKWVAPGLILQISAEAKAGAAIRYGLTASSKVGAAVIRNRARRRLRALAHELLPLHARPGYDYVLIARVTTPKRVYADLKQDLVTALKKLGAWQDA
jgi:ribonuclease P protein component